jgi:formylglycine-generating enzyme required for sulfatase activity
MVDVGGYCIDSTEVTNSHYADFLASNPSAASQPTFCQWNTSFVPGQGWPATGKDTHPVVYVNWCDADAYCRWAGKRLCGKIGGGSTLTAEATDPTKSQWYNACTAGGTRKYPYGNTYSATACNGKDRGVGATMPVGASSGCVGGFPWLFDMSGNVQEYDDTCRPGPNPTPDWDLCAVRGGSYGDDASKLGCAPSGPFQTARGSGSPGWGFRCCGP